MSFENGVLVGAGATAAAVVAGIVAYKVVKKRKPRIIEKAKKSVVGIKNKTFEIVKGAKGAFREGYVSTKAASATSRSAPAKA